MGQHFLPGNPPVAITLRKTAQARRISLRISRLDGRVTLTCPLRVSDREALAFAHEKADWLRQNLIAHPGPARIGIGAELPFEGRLLRIASGTGRLVRVEGADLLVPGASERAAARIGGFLKQVARDRLAAASDHYAARLGRGYTRLSLRDTRSRWGSCTADGGLMYSWRLIMAPPAVLDYVAAHEVAHLRHMDHSPRFWATVAALMPDYAKHRAWLRQHGGDLMLWRFRD